MKQYGKRSEDLQHVQEIAWPLCDKIFNDATTTKLDRDIRNPDHVIDNFCRK